MPVKLIGLDRTGIERVSLNTRIKTLDELPEVIREFMQINKELLYKVELVIC